MLWKILIAVVLALAVWGAVALVRMSRHQGRTTVGMDFRKAKEHERRKNTDLSAYP